MKIGPSTDPRNAVAGDARARSTGTTTRRGNATPAAVEPDPTPPAQAAAPSCAPRRSAAPARVPVSRASARQRGPEGVAGDSRPPGAQTAPSGATVRATTRATTGFHRATTGRIPPAEAPSGPSEARSAARATGTPGVREGASAPDTRGSGHPAGGAPSRGRQRPHAAGTGPGTTEGHAAGNRAEPCTPIVLILQQQFSGNFARNTPEPGSAERPRRPQNPELAAALAEDPELGRANYHKRHGLKLARHLNAAGLGKVAARVGRCSLTLCLDERAKIMHREACRVRVCPMCQAMRASRWTQDLRAGLLAMLASEAEPLTFAHLTLTVRNCAVGELRAHMRAIHAGLDRMTRRAVFPALGYVRNTEVTVNLRTREVHPHVHMLLVLRASYYAAPWHYERTKGRRRIVPGYMTHTEYVDLWQDCARLDYAPSVHIQAVNLSTPRGRQALYEVAKYGVKPASVAGMSAEMLGTFLTQIRGTRAIAVTGLLNRYVREPDESDEPEERIADAVATWDERARRYTAESLREVVE